MPSRRLRTAAVTTCSIALAVALASTLYAGRRQPSLVLTVLFAFWVSAPFAAAICASLVASRWPTRLQIAIPFAGIVCSASAAFYACVAFAHFPVKAGFAFLVAPHVSWAGMGVAVAVAAAVRGGPRPSSGSRSLVAH